MFLQCFPQCPKFLLENVSVLTISMQAQYLENEVSLIALVLRVIYSYVNKSHVRNITNFEGMVSGDTPLLKR
jgi:hypothetical protein